jgi:hypothetical protein
MCPPVSTKIHLPIPVIYPLAISARCSSCRNTLGFLHKYRFEFLLASDTPRGLFLGVMSTINELDHDLVRKASQGNEEHLWGAGRPVSLRQSKPKHPIPVVAIVFYCERLFGQ